jgi:D-amino-acid dehydrogenase
VTVVDRTGVAAGASWGNAGWIAPALSTPLNDPRTLRYALRSLPNRAAPVRIPLSADPTLWRFLLRFAANCRESSWTRAVRANLTLNHECIAAYDELVSNGVDAPIPDAPITALFRSSADAEHLLDQLHRLQDAGQPSSTTELTAAELREQVPLASSGVAVGVRINGQRFVNPGRFVQALADSVVERGAALDTVDVAGVRASGQGVVVQPRTGPALTADVTVIATGAWLPKLVRRWVRVPVQAGRGYSFTVPLERPVFGPIYLPDVRVACTPLEGKLRVTSMMELRRPDAAVSAGVIDAIVDAAGEFFDGVRWAERDDIWVGPRPLSPDGRPLVGPVLDNRIFVAGGHGMWGMKQGPATGRLLAEQITTGKQPPGLSDFDPLR